MPVYEYECPTCQSVIEVQQKIADPPLSSCPECQSPVRKLMSMSSFQLKGGGWYADGYSSNGTDSTCKAAGSCDATKKEAKKEVPTCPKKDGAPCCA